MNSVPRACLSKAAVGGLWSQSSDAVAQLKLELATSLASVSAGIQMILVGDVSAKKPVSNCVTRSGSS
jgi:hypothetical protein